MGGRAGRARGTQGGGPPTRTAMSVVLSSPPTRRSSGRWAHAESDRSLRFVAHVERLVAREAERDRVTGLTPSEARAERTVRAGAVQRVRVESVHNPLIRALGRRLVSGAA